MSIPTGAVLNTVAYGNRPEGVEVPVYSNRNPSTQDVQYPIGKTWINMSSNAVYVLTSQLSQNGVTTSNWAVSASPTGAVSTLTGNSGGAVVPAAGNINILGSGVLAFAGAGSTLTGSITPGTSLISTLTGGTGGALSPTAGNLNILGTANQITSTGAGSTITLSTPAVFTAPGSITAATSVTATLGNITATNGNVVLGTAGNKLSIATGANASVGTSGAMTAGSVTVNTTAVTANSLIFLTANTLGTVTVPSAYYVSAIVAGTSFTITASDATDTSTIDWFLIN